MTYKIIATGSKGNAVIYNDHILVDCGVSYKNIEPFINDINIILLTHRHSDHINKKTLIKIIKQKPSIRIAAGEFLAEILNETTPEAKVDFMEAGTIYKYPGFSVSPITLYHDVPNFGWRIFENQEKIIHITDTHTLEGISAPGYDLYAIEQNYCEDLVQQEIDAAQAEGRYTRAFNSMNSHLSRQQTIQWIEENRKAGSRVVELHQSSEFGYGF